MIDEPKKSWRECLMIAPGPHTFIAAMWLFIKGVLMGAADVVPGVSGGTVAFITGIYQDFINAVASFNAQFIHDIVRLRGRAALSRVHLRFLICLVSGIGLSIVMLAGVIRYLMDEHAILTWSLFFGLILGSIVIVAREITKWTIIRVLLFIFGIFLAWWICGLLPVETPETSWFYFLCGIIGICAMVLPGISGSFLLLILGKYYAIISAIHTLKDAARSLLLRDFNNAYNLLFAGVMSPLWLLTIFALGQICGIIGFSRVLKWLLSRWHEATMCVLAGLMIGALRKIYPWKHQVVVDFIQAENKTKVIQEVMIMPTKYAGDYLQIVNVKIDGATNAIREVTVNAGEPLIIPAVALMIGGVILVLVIEYLARGKSEK